MKADTSRKPPQHFDERSAVLLRTRNLKMARSAHAYVRGSTNKFYEWLEAADGRGRRLDRPSGSVGIAMSAISDRSRMRTAGLPSRYAILIKPLSAIQHTI
jgi:hypothetical protein